MQLKEIAYARSGDKGANANIGVIAKDPARYGDLQKWVTVEKVERFFQGLKPLRVVRYELPNLSALNFVLYGVLGKGASLNLRLDAQGKALGQALLEMPLDPFEEG